MRGLSAAVLAGMLLVPAVADAHSRLVFPPSRTDEDFLEEAPCGDAPESATRTVFEAGETIQMRWELTQNHFGMFRVAFSPEGEEGFEDGVIGTLPDIEDQFEYEQAVPLPHCICDRCVIQLVQFTPTGLAGYYSCADIELVQPDGPEVPMCSAVPSTTSETQAGEEEEGDAEIGESSSDGGGSTSGTSQESDGDGGCRTGHPSWVALMLLAFGARRRRGR